MMALCTSQMQFSLGPRAPENRPWFGRPLKLNGENLLIHQ